MKKTLLLVLSSCFIITVSAQNNKTKKTAAPAQATKTELYDLVKKILYDSTGYSNVGDWDKKFPIKWKDDHVIMSDDTAINFYRSGTVDLTINGKTFMQDGQPVKWTIMLKGPRMGYTSFSMVSSPSKELQPKYTIDSLFGNKPFKARLLKSCDAKTLAGYYYYEVKLPKKDVAFIKFSWISVNGNSALRVDCFDDWSKYAVKLDCPK